MPPNKPQDISHLLAAVGGRHRVPALAGGVVRGADLQALGAWGVRKRGDTVPVTPNDQFHLGSETKAMTATLCAMLVGQKKLAWTDTCEEMFPELAHAMNPAFRAVQLQQLLTQRSGCPADAHLAELYGRMRRFHGNPAAGREMVARWVLARPPQAKPGSKYIYSNCNYIIAGHAAERVAGMPWERLITRRLFEPLHMTSAGFGAPGVRGALNEPWGHTGAGQPVAPGPLADNPEILGPAGTVHAAIADWAKFIAFHLTAGRSHPGLLSAQSFHTLHTPPRGATPAYAMGWMAVRRPWARGVALTHNGSNTLWYATAWLAPRRNFAVLVACNQGGKPGAGACDDAAAALVHWALAHG